MIQSRYSQNRMHHHNLSKLRQHKFASYNFKIVSCSKNSHNFVWWNVSQFFPHKKRSINVQLWKLSLVNFYQASLRLCTIICVFFCVFCFSQTDSKEEQNVYTMRCIHEKTHALLLDKRAIQNFTDRIVIIIITIIIICFYENLLINISGPLTPYCSTVLWITFCMGAWGPGKFTSGHQSYYSNTKKALFLMQPMYLWKQNTDKIPGPHVGALSSSSVKGDKMTFSALSLS